MNAKKTTSLDFAEVKFYDHYVITQIKEGIALNQSHLQVFKKVFGNHFNHTPYVYISDRAMDYNVNPVDYLTFDFSDDLLGVAIVTDDIKARNAQFEKKFIKKPYKIFTSMDSAIAWAQEVYNQKISSQ